MRVNTLLLEKKITDSGLKQTYLIKELGISAQAFNKKKNNKTPFRIAEAYVLCDLLNISSEEKTNIFFAD